MKESQKIKDLKDAISLEIQRLQFIDYPSESSNEYLEDLQEELRELKQER